VNFLNEKQRDPRLNEILYPLYDEKRAAEIITTYEQNEEARNTSEFSSAPYSHTTRDYFAPLMNQKRSTK
jgi:hypothetical protein